MNVCKGIISLKRKMKKNFVKEGGSEKGEFKKI